MARDDDQTETSEPLHRNTWFRAVERPVASTVFVKPVEQDAEAVGDDD